jgi:uncharacterized RDD family membrane protein YckC
VSEEAIERLARAVARLLIFLIVVAIMSLFVFLLIPNWQGDLRIPLVVILAQCLTSKPLDT